MRFVKINFKSQLFHNSQNFLFAWRGINGEALKKPKHNRNTLNLFHNSQNFPSPMRGIKGEGSTKSNYEKGFTTFLFIFLLLFSLNSTAQTREQKKEQKLKLEQEKKAKAIEQKKINKEKRDKRRYLRKHPENITEFPKNFMFKPRYTFPEVTLNVSSRKKTGEKFNWKSYTPGLVGAGVKIKKVYISGAFAIPESPAQEKKYGKTTSRDIYINFSGRVMMWTLFYRAYKGFYLSDYRQFYPNLNKDSVFYPKSPNLHVVEAGINLGFNFNRNFSLNAAFPQSERQKKSAGSFLINVSERYQHVQTDTINIVPPAQSDNYPNLDRFISGDFLTTIISLGAGYQVVMGKFHFTPVLLLGSGVQFQNYQQTGKNRFWINVPSYAQFKAQLGYNGDHFFTNIIYGLEFNSIPIKESRMRLFYNVIEFNMGIRF